MSEDDLPLLGTLTGTQRFHLLELLGRGAMGLVYRARDDEMAMEVALKTLSTRNPDQLYRIKQEFRVLAGIRHPHLVELYDLVVTDRDSFFTMELLEGVRFQIYVRGSDLVEGTPLVFDEPHRERFVDAARQLVLGLDHLHAAGRLHRDVKPSNVMVTTGGRVVLLDFGLATVLATDGRPDATSSGVVGTFAYMAPEAAWGRALTAAADWYSVGVVFHEVLTGLLPYRSAPAKALSDKARAAPPPLARLAPEVPPELDRLVVGLLSPSPDDRPGADEILAALESCRPSETVSVPRPPSLAALPFVDREHEMARLESALEDLPREGAAVVHLAGPSGIGKSELVRRFLANVESRGGVVILRSRCHPQEAVPYKAVDRVVDDLTRYLLSLPVANSEAFVPRHAGALVRLFPVLARVPAFAASRERGETGEPHEIRRRGFAALRDLFGRISERRPLVIWIDDLQWGDEDSTALLDELTRPPDTPAMLLLLSYRLEDRPAIPLVRVLEESLSGANRLIELGPLNADRTRELAQRLCVGRMHRYVDSIASESAGSPFFLGEFVRQLSRRVRAGDEATGGLDLAQVVHARLEQLSPPARDLLETVAVAGTPLPAALVIGASGVRERGRLTLLQLESENLLRVSSSGGESAVEVYHDRIREGLLAGMAPEALRRRHGDLAEVLLQQPVPDPEALFRHTLGAERLGEAAGWALRAAERAASALAFLEASQLYGRALELKPWSDVERAWIQVEQAQALVNAGRGAQAAPLFLAAATMSPGQGGLELRRRAAEQFLTSGHLARGVEEFRRLVGDLGLHYPPSPARALAGAVARLAQLRLRGLHFRRRDAEQAEALSLIRIDACDSAAKVLIVVDPVRGMYFGVQALLRALRLGEPLRVVRGLCIAGANLVPVGGPVAAFGRRMLERAREIAEESGDGDPYLTGLTSITRAQMLMVEGRWREVLELCDGGVGLLRDHCRGVTWECDVGRMGALRALEELGEVAEVSRRAERFLRDAEELGDLYAMVTARLYASFWRLARADPEGARSQARVAVSEWPSEDASLQHFYALRVESYADLYEGHGDEAWRRITDAWPGLVSSNLLRHTLMRSDAHLMRGRAALALAERGGSEAERLLRRAEEDAARIEREGRAGEKGQAELLRAGAAALRGRREAVLQHLRRGAELFESIGAPLHAAYARRRQGDVLGAEGAALVRDADAYLTSCGIREPQRWLALQAPGFTKRAET